MTEQERTLVNKIMQLQALLHRYHGHNMRMHGPTASPHRGQGRVLALLKLQPEISQKELVYLLGMRPQSLGELLAKLEKQEYIRREPAENDKRAMMIYLTEKGREAAEQPEPADEEQLFQCLTEEEQKQLHHYLGRLIASLEGLLAEQLEADPREAFGPGYQRFGHGAWPKDFPPGWGHLQPHHRPGHGRPGYNCPAHGPGFGPEPAEEEENEA